LEQNFLDAIKSIIYLLNHDSPRTEFTEIKENDPNRIHIKNRIKTGLF